LDTDTSPLSSLNCLYNLSVIIQYNNNFHKNQTLYLAIQLINKNKNKKNFLDVKKAPTLDYLVVNILILSMP